MVHKPYSLTAEPDVRDELGQQLAALAYERADPDLAARPWVAIGEPRRAVDAAVPIVEAHPEHLTNFESLLRGVPDETSLAWCMVSTSRTLAPLAIGLASEILAARDLSVEGLVAACDGRAIGAAVFARVCRSTNEALAEDVPGAIRAFFCPLVAVSKSRRDGLARPPSPLVPPLLRTCQASGSPRACVEADALMRDNRALAVLAGWVQQACRLGEA